MNVAHQRANSDPARESAQELLERLASKSERRARPPGTVTIRRRSNHLTPEERAFLDESASVTASGLPAVAALLDRIGFESVVFEPTPDSGLDLHDVTVKVDDGRASVYATDNADFDLVVDVALVGSTIEVEEIRFRPTGGPRSLPSSRMFRQLVAPTLREQLEWIFDDPRMLHWLGADWEAATMTPRRSGRGGTDDRFYALWARHYVDALSTHPRAPVKHLAETHHLSNGSIRQYLDRARRRGLLERPAGRTAGGSLTAKAIELLATLPEDGE